MICSTPKQPTWASLPEVSSHFCPCALVPTGSTESIQTDKQPLARATLCQAAPRVVIASSRHPQSSGLWRKGSVAGWQAQVAKGHQTYVKRNGRPCLDHCCKGAGMEAGLNVYHSPALDCYVPPISTCVLSSSFSSMWAWASACPLEPNPRSHYGKQIAAQSRRNGEHPLLLSGPATVTAHNSRVPLTMPLLSWTEQTYHVESG